MCSLLSKLALIRLFNLKVVQETSWEGIDVEENLPIKLKIYCRLRDKH